MFQLFWSSLVIDVFYVYGPFYRNTGGGVPEFCSNIYDFCKNQVHLIVTIFVVCIVQEWHFCSYACVCLHVAVMEGPGNFMSQILSMRYASVILGL